MGPVKPILILLLAAIIGYRQYVTKHGHLSGLPSVEHVGGNVTLLPYGTTHYYLEGPEDGPLVVFLHGIVSPANVFDGLARDLTSNGFRLLRFDFYGRGWSDSPDTTYGADLFTSQLASLLNKLGLANRRFHLIGLSMGGAVAGYYARAFPDSVDKLVLLAPAGFPAPVSAVARFLDLPVVSDLIVHGLAKVALTRTLHVGFANQTKVQPLLEKGTSFIDLLLSSSPGFMRSMLSTLRSFPLLASQHVFEDIGRHPRDVLFIWGTKDVTCPYENAAKFLSVMPNARLITLQDESHNYIIESPELTHEPIMEFLNKK
eukprot:TRINITY_DN20208_c0_g1_i1.p1 TRINITY_DN20208_c0_g1~~TRINITY_DN20208_c0_g1_i1.p1  ORF type:complete len:316 (+),score=97.91 TRINITY_DN20208_c0_g1_i1:89-1036(+)